MPVGTVIYTQSGYAICTGSRKQLDHREEWVILMDIRPPQTPEEVLRVARAMARDWRNTTEHLALLDADDARDQGLRDRAAAMRADYIRRLTEEGLL